MTPDARPQTTGRRIRLPPDSLIIDAVVALLFAALLSPLLRVDLLNGPELPTGGDLASHVLYAWLFDHVVAPSGHLTAWLPEVFGGYPLHAYYFPLPFVAASLLAKLTGFAAALKWVTVLPALLLPGSVFAVSRHALRQSGLAAFGGALGALAFLVHEQNSIWGGNLLSILSGEFAYSWGLWLAFITLAMWVRTANDGHGWALAGTLEALTALGHGYPLLVVGFASWLLVIDAPRRRSMMADLFKGHALAFLLLAGWLWPMLEMHGFTIPNDGSSSNDPWEALLPRTLWPVLAGGVLALPLVLRRPPRVVEPVRTALFFLIVAVLVLVFWMVADRVGLLDIRFLPMTWLFGAIAAGWLIGTALGMYFPNAKPSVLAVALLLAQLGWLAPLVHDAPEWARWNFSGSTDKPQWQALAKLFPAMSGQLDSPRLLFEHDPANQDLGSTRSLEALPLFLGGRPVLEGLYMESALLGPAVYQLQSEVSAHPSSPLSRFPSGSLEPRMAATHMQLLGANQVLLRSAEAKRSLLESGLFVPIAESPPFLLLQLKNFDSTPIDGSSHLWQLKPRRDWMQDSHAWFQSTRRLDTEWPVYVDHPGPDTLHAFSGAHPAARIDNVQIGRDSISFSTSAPGRPHLIKVTYHPRWQLETKGEVFLAAPGFLLVVPGETSVRLVFGTTLIGRIGAWSSSLTVLYLLYLLIRRHPVAGSRNGGTRSIRLLPYGLSTLAMLGYCSWLHWTSPTRIYAEAWTEMNAGHFTHAAERFLDAHQHRHAPPAQEEALFWAAKALERSGNPTEAGTRYQELFDNYHGYWVAESLYEYAQIERSMGRASLAWKAEQRLRRDYPENSWTLKLPHADGTP